MMKKRMKQTITFLFIIFFISKVEAKKMIYPIEVMAGSADLIVVGEIEIVKDNLYIFNISETLKGNLFNSISVEIFKEWECDQRFAKPEKGQKLCLFLKRGLTNWEIINGSTGELLISNSLITLGGFEEYKHIDYKFTPYQLSLEEFKNGIREFCKCFIFIGEYGFTDENAHFEQIVLDKQIYEFKAMSDFSFWLWKKMEKYQVVTK
jgi:hypothetical protein